MTRTVSINSKGKPVKKYTSRVDYSKSNRDKLSKKLKSSHKKTGRTVTRKLAKLILIALVVIQIGALGGSVYAFSWLQKLNEDLPSPDAPFIDPPLASTIYDRSGGTQLYRVIGDFNSDSVDINVIPDTVKWAFLAAEDNDFYNHNGFDTAGIIRCGATYVRAGGENICGGSTITQQLIKNTALKDEKSKVTRKIKELFMSTKVEQEYDKDEILQMYLSVISFGSNVVGIETAAKYYFDKDPKDLTLAEATILASIVQDPSYLSPTKPVDGDTVTSQLRVKSRQQYALDQIEKYKNKINDQIINNAKQKASEEGREFKEDEIQIFTDELINEARSQELVYRPPVATDKLAGHFVDFVLSELQTKNYKNGEEPFTPAELQNSGLKIHTSLDYELQKIAEEAVQKGGNDYKYWNLHNAALMTLVPSTGEIITMAGSKNFVGDDEGCDENLANCKYNPEVNILTSLQSPGSTNKPLGFMEAFDKGLLYPGSLLPNIPISIGSYVPKNWNGGFTGVNQTAREMLRQSMNIPALIVIEMIGIDSYIQKSRDFGYTTYTDDQDLGHSVILGGTSVYPVEHAGAYAVFANQGDYVEPNAILKIEDRDGNVIYEAKPQREQVGNPQAIYLLNQTLMNYDHFTTWDGREVAAKTGTSESNIDSWIIAYSPDFVTVGWAGNNNNDPLDQSYGYPIFVVTPWLKDYMSKIGGAPYFSAKTPFTRPGFVVRGGGPEDCNPNGECVGLASDWMIQNKKPPAYVTKEKARVCTDETNKLARDIDIAAGKSEEREFVKYKMPAASWQNFMDEYFRGRNESNGAPTERCTINRSGGASGPYFYINSPAIGAVVNGTINVTGNIFSTNGNIESAVFQLNGQQIGTATRFTDMNETLTIPTGLDSGTYTLRIRATDSSGVTNNQDISIVIGSATSNTFTFIQQPPATMTIGSAANVKVQYTQSLSNVKLFAINLANNQVVELGTMSSAGGSQYSFNVPATTAGSYKLFATGLTSVGGSIQSVSSTTITVN